MNRLSISSVLAAMAFAALPMPAMAQNSSATAPPATAAPPPKADNPPPTANPPATATPPDAAQTVQPVQPVIVQQAPPPAAPPVAISPDAAYPNGFADPANPFGNEARAYNDNEGGFDWGLLGLLGLLGLIPLIRGNGPRTIYVEREEPRRVVRERIDE
jgi:hypothetical protein